MKIYTQKAVYVYIKDKGGEKISAFFEWQRNRKIYPLNLGGHSGGGSYGHFFDPKDMSKILTFLKSL